MLFRRPLAHLVINSVGTYIVDILLAAFVVTGGFWAYVVIGLFVSIMNMVLKPILKVVSLPVIFLTFGLFLLVINAVILFVVQYLLTNFQFGEISLEISGLITYIVAAFVYSVFHFIAWKIFK
jgi:putative membrane protein